eukprot:2338181-Prymnesium_polylepis.1
MRQRFDSHACSRRAQALCLTRSLQEVRLCGCKGREVNDRRVRAAGRVGSVVLRQHPGTDTSVLRV